MAKDDQVVELLEELVIWTKFIARDRLVSVLESLLSDPRYYQAYVLSDGTRSQTEIGKAVGLSQPRISSLMANWAQQGILRQKDGRWIHLINPKALGIGPPEEVRAQDPAVVNETEEE